MMAAAQAAAEAALYEAAAREAADVNFKVLARDDLTESSEQVFPGHAGAASKKDGGPYQDTSDTTRIQEMEDKFSDEQGAANMDTLFQQMLADQEKQEQEQQRKLHEHLAAAAEAAVRSRPDEHFLTIAQNGTILGATETVSGFPPNSLLMTSSYDTVHDEDIVGLHAIKARFWEKDRPDVHAIFRRRTLEGDWVWLSAAVVSFVDNPVPGFVIHECRVKDEEFARRIRGITRISVLLVHAVETAILQRNIQNAVLDESIGDKSADGPMEAIPGVADDAAALRELLKTATTDRGTDFSNSTNPMQQLMEAAASGGAIRSENDSKDGVTGGTSKSNQKDDPLNEVRSGTGLDLSKVQFNFSELKMVTLVLSGRITVEELIPLILMALNSPKRDISFALERYVTDSERQHSSDDAGTVHGFRHSKKNRNISLGLGLAGFSKSERYDHDQRSTVKRRHKKVTSISTLPESHNSRHTSSSSEEVSLATHSRRLDAGHDISVPASPPPYDPPPLSILNLSHTNIGNIGMEMLSEIVYANTPMLKTLDIGFCGIEEKGILALCRGLRSRRRKALPSIQALVLSGNFISYKAAKELGLALSSAPEKTKRSFRKRGQLGSYESTGYEDDYEFDDEDEGDDDIPFGVDRVSREKRSDENDSSNPKVGEAPVKVEDGGLQVLHLGCTSITEDGLYQLLLGLGQDCPIRELNIASNNVGASGARLLVAFLEGKGMLKFKKGHAVMPNLDRLDMSNNNLGNDGTAELTRVISKRLKVNIVDLRLSSNNIGAGGIETIMNKLLQHNLVSLSLDNNTIVDRGCQLVAASLPSMHHLTSLNLSFNQIGSRGVTTLMRSLIGCESITYLGLSGNVMKISGAIAMGFALAQHPRLAELDLDNCCLSQVAQCHIVAGIISNRWVPMRTLNGFRAGPPMVAIGALDVLAQHLNNEDCFRIRRDIQMKTILQWMESNRAAKRSGVNQNVDKSFLTPDFVSGMNDESNAPSQSAYLRMIDWLSRIPFDEDELEDLRKYFYDLDGGDGGDGMRGSDGFINLKHRGDLLAALGSEVAEEIRDSNLFTEFEGDSDVGLDIENMGDVEEDEIDLPAIWKRRIGGGSVELQILDNDSMPNPESSWLRNLDGLKPTFKRRRKRNKKYGVDDSHSSVSYEQGVDKAITEESLIIEEPAKKVAKENKGNFPAPQSSTRSMGARSSVSSLSKQSVLSKSSSIGSNHSQSDRKTKALKARITMFPPFQAKLDLLKASAQDMMDNEEDPTQQDIIAQQFAEASLTLLRQLRYHCMNSGLDGWRQGKIRRKVLIVDDSLVTRKMVSRAFEKANFIVDTAENGMEGVTKLKESIYDIAFMDIDMPIMNGFDATKTLRAWEDAKRPGARQPICALTAAYVDDFERSELMKFKDAGLDVMESKPCNIPRLFKVVDDVSPMFSDLSLTVTQHLNEFL